MKKYQWHHFVTVHFVVVLCHLDIFIGNLRATGELRPPSVWLVTASKSQVKPITCIPVKWARLRPCYLHAGSLSWFPGSLHGMENLLLSCYESKCCCEKLNNDWCSSDWTCNITKLMKCRWIRSQAADFSLHNTTQHNTFPLLCRQEWFNCNHKWTKISFQFLHCNQK